MSTWGSAYRRSCWRKWPSEITFSSSLLTRGLLSCILRVANVPSRVSVWLCIVLCREIGVTLYAMATSNANVMPNTSEGKTVRKMVHRHAPHPLATSLVTPPSPSPATTVSPADQVHSLRLRAEARAGGSSLQQLVRVLWSLTVLGRGVRASPLSPLFSALLPLGEHRLPHSPFPRPAGPSPPPHSHARKHRPAAQCCLGAS